MRRMTALLFASVLMLTVGISAFAEEGNIAPEAQVTASKNGDDSGSTPQAVNDGIAASSGTGNTKWFIKSEAKSQWLQFSFETQVSIDSALVVSGYPTNDQDIAADFKFQYNKGGSWVDVPGGSVQKNEGHDCTVTFDSVVTSNAFRYVPTSDALFRIREIELYQASGAEREAYQCPADVSGTKYEQAVCRLTQLGLLEEGEADRFYPEYPISRAEFLTWLLRFMGAEQTSERRKIFEDVEIDDPSAATITAAYDLMLISGEEGGMFYPSRELTYNEACVMLVTALGYRAEAEARGGYPAGYTAVASRLDLGAGLTLRRDGYLNRGDAVLLLDNMLDADAATPMKYGSEQVEYETVPFAAHYHHILRTAGVVEANEKLSLTAAPPVKAGEVRIDGVVYRDDSGKADALLGCSVDLYYREESDGLHILYAETNGRTKIIEMDAEEVDDASFSGISYVQEDRKKRVSLAPKTRILLNGSTVGITEKSLQPAYGRLRLIDNDGDGSCDVIFVSDQTITRVTGVDAETGILYGDGISWHTKQYQNAYFYRGNMAKTLDKISAGDIVTVEASADDTLLQVFISSKTLNGTVTGKEEDEILIDGIRYPILSELLAQILPGTSGKFYLSHDGLIAYAETAETRMRYGLVLGWNEGDSMFASRAKILAEDGTIREYKCRDRVIINGAAASHPSLEADQVIRFCLDADGKIRSIATEQPAGSMEYTDDAAAELIKFENNGDYYCTGSILTDRNTKKNLFLSKQTVVFLGPQNRDGASDKEYSVQIGSSAIRSGKVEGALSIYNLDREGTAAVIYHQYKSKNLLLDSTTKTAVVTMVCQTLNAEGQSIRQFNFLIDGAEVVYTEGEDSAYASTNNTFVNHCLDYTQVRLSDLKIGDVVQVNADAQGEISSYRVLYRAEDLQVDGLLQYIGGSGNQATYYPPLETLSGRVSYIGKNTISFLAGGVKYTYPSPSCNVYCYDSGKGSVSMGSIKDLLSLENTGNGTRVFVRVNGKQIKDIVIYR